MRHTTATQLFSVLTGVATWLLCAAGTGAAAQPDPTWGKSGPAASTPVAKPVPTAAPPAATPKPTAGSLSASETASVSAGDEESDDEVGEHDGTIVRIDGDVLFFDVSHERGLVVGQTVRVLRTIIARHPVTGRRLVDHFPLGSLVVEGVGGVLSYGKAQRRIALLVKVGDVVNIASPPVKEQRVAAVPATPPGGGAGGTANAAGAGRPTGTPPAAVVAALPDGDAAQLQRIFQATLGRPLDDRIAAYQSFLAAHRESPYRGGIEQELTHLRTMQRTLELAMSTVARGNDAPARASTVPTGRQDIPVTTTLLPRQIYAGEPLEVALYVANPRTVSLALLYVRRAADLTFRRLVMAEDATGYYRISVPRDLLAPGEVELFVGVEDAGGRLALVAGDSNNPREVAIEPAIGPPPPPGPDHSAVSGFFEFVDFNRFRGNDYYFHAEADFMYRIGGVLYSVRTGFGTLSGYGESVRNLDDLNLAPRQVGINFGYVEGELRFHRLVGLAARGLAGQSRSGAGGGAELKLRIGSEMGTNLIIGGAIISDFGALAQLKLEWNVFRNWPMSVTVVATNQPVQTDLGVRLIYQVGWRLRRWFAPTARIGYDVRNINHGGLSLGLGVVMGW